MYAVKTKKPQLRGDFALFIDYKFQELSNLLATIHGSTLSGVVAFVYSIV